MRANRPKLVIAAAALLLLALGAPTAWGATRPRAGAVVSKPPLLNWPGVPGAVRYNVQLYKQTPSATRRVLSLWPTRSRYQLRWAWRYQGRARGFTVARYFWYVWPWLGSHYGPRRVGRSFVYGRPPVNTSPPTLSGTAREGATLTAATGTWTGLPAPTLSYRWRRCAVDGTACVTIDRAVLPTYRIGAEDIDHALKVVVVATNIARTVSAPSAPSRKVLAAPPNNVARPRVAGHPHVTGRLRATVGDWLSSRPVTYSYQWRRCSRNGVTCSGIRGATARTYRIRAADAAGRLSVVVRARNSGGANAAASVQSAVVGLAFEGTTAADLIRGTLGSDLIRARGGADTMYGGRGGDRIYSGRGSDEIYGGPGADFIFARDHRRDRVSCGTGKDTVIANRRDRIRSGCEHVIRR